MDNGQVITRSRFDQLLREEMDKLRRSASCPLSHAWKGPILVVFLFRFYKGGLPASKLCAWEGEGCISCSDMLCSWPGRSLCLFPKWPLPISVWPCTFNIAFEGAVSNKLSHGELLLRSTYQLVAFRECVSIVVRASFSSQRRSSVRLCEGNAVASMLQSVLLGALK